MYAGSNKSDAEANDFTLNIRAKIDLSKVNNRNSRKSLENVQS